MMMVMMMTTTRISCFYGCCGSEDGGCGVCVVVWHLFFLFRDIKISFGAFASTDSFVDVFSALPHGRE